MTSPLALQPEKMQQQHPHIPHPLFTQSEVKEIQRFLSLLLIIVLPKFQCKRRDIYFLDDRQFISLLVYPELSVQESHMCCVGGL